MKKFALSLMAISVLSLSACESVQNSGTKELLGGVGGAVIGGTLGSKVGKGNGQLWATGAGALLGALAGAEIGRSLDKADLLYAQKANEQAYEAPLGETISWNNPDSGHSGTVTPVRDGYTQSGGYCRQYEQTIYIDGQAETGIGTACQRSDGNWDIVN